MTDTHGGNIFKFAHEHRIEPYEVVDFSANINPLGPSQKGMDALERRIRYISHYPDLTNDDVMNAVADVYGVPKESILLGNGAAELLYAVGRLPGYTGAFVPAPGFSEYKASMDASDIPVRHIHYRRVESDENGPYFEVPYLALQTFAAELKGQDGRIIVFLGNPNNPDGTLLDRNRIDELAIMLEQADSLLVADESFIDFIGNESLRDNSHSLRDLIVSRPNLIIVHSFTKFYSVPGLRVGAIFAHPDMIEALRPYIPAWSVNTLAQAYIEEALTDTEYIKRTKQTVEDEKKYLYTELSKMKGLKAYKPSANFMLLHITDPLITAESVQEILATRNTVVRNCINYESLDEKWMRIAIKDHTSNEALVSLLEDIFNS